jgi:hypothetical protein
MRQPDDPSEVPRICAHDRKTEDESRGSNQEIGIVNGDAMRLPDGPESRRTVEDFGGYGQTITVSAEFLKSQFLGGGLLLAEPSQDFVARNLGKTKLPVRAQICHCVPADSKRTFTGQVDYV